MPLAKGPSWKQLAQEQATVLNRAISQIADKEEEIERLTRILDTIQELATRKTDAIQQER